jgi:hypothetical protein
MLMHPLLSSSISRNFFISIFLNCRACDPVSAAVAQVLLIGVSSRGGAAVEGEQQ